MSQVDLPPSYDDLMMGNGSSSVDELKKKQPLGEDQVEDGFSAKLVLEDDEEILEPLPQNSNNQVCSPPHQASSGIAMETRGAQCKICLTEI